MHDIQGCDVDSIDRNNPSTNDGRAVSLSHRASHRGSERKLLPPMTAYRPALSPALTPLYGG